MGLIIPSDGQSGSPLYEQIYQYIKDEIRSARLEIGSRLPPTRVLAQDLKVSRGTAQMVYDQLLLKGYIEALPCKGYYMCKIEELVEVRQRSSGPFVVKQELGGQAYEVSFSSREISLESLPFNI